LTWWAVVGVNSARVDSSAARWNTKSMSNCASTRSSRAASVIDPVNSRATNGRSDGSSGAMSMVTIERPAAASRPINPCPISPPAPVTRVTGVRMA
jgi:hypothetical protein